MMTPVPLFRRRRPPRDHRIGVESRLALCVATQLGLAVGLLAADLARGGAPAEKITYVDHVQPIFRQHCFACHGPDTKKNDLALDSYAAAITGGASGEVVAAGDPDGSYLWMLVNHDAEPAMPPGGAKLSATELGTIRAWIAGGLLERADSKARKAEGPAVAAFTPAADNRPAGEPAMPQGVLREPVLHAAHAGPATALATSPWAPLTAVGAPFQVSLYNSDSGELAGILPFVEGSPFVLRFSRDGSLLLAAGGRSAALGVAAVFDVVSGRRLATVGDELDAVLAADLSADHALVALGGPRKIVRVFRVADGSLAYELSKHTDWITAIEFSPDGALLATADRSGGLRLWEAATGRDRGELRGHAEQVCAVSWRDDGAVLASACEDDTVRLWRPDGQQIKSWGAHGGGALSVSFARGGELVTAGRDGRVKTWTSDGTAIRDLAGLDDLALAARFTHDGARVVAADWRGNVRAYDAETGDVAATFDPNPPTLDMRRAELEAAANKARAAAEAARAQAAAAEAALAAAEQQLAEVEAERIAWRELAATLGAELAALGEELSGVETAAADAGAERDEAAAAAADHQAVVEKLVAQLAELQRTLDQAQAQLDLLVAAREAKAQAAVEADERAGRLRAAIKQLERQLADLEVIQTLRGQHADGK